MYEKLLRGVQGGGFLEKSPLEKRGNFFIMATKDILQEVSVEKSDE
jgi:hypothetical protein